MNCTDQKRLEFIRQRDGITAMRAFIKQAIAVYRSTNLKMKRKYGKHWDYRALYIESYKFHKGQV